MFLILTVFGIMGSLGVAIGGGVYYGFYQTVPVWAHYVVWPNLFVALIGICGLFLKRGY